MIWSDTKTGQVRVTVPHRQALYDDLCQHFDEESGFSVATLNLDHVVKLARDPDFATAYAQQSHVTADGNPIVWLSRLAGQQDISLVPGSELIEPLVSIAAEKGISVGLLGATDHSLRAAADSMRRQYPNLKIALSHAPSMMFDPDGPEADDIIALLKESGARLVFLALGAPKQERFAARAQKELPQTGFLSIGAGLDFISGAQHRAPTWVRALAAEWLWRLAKDPRRLSARYGACIAALPNLVVQALSTRWQRKT